MYTYAALPERVCKYVSLSACAREILIRLMFIARADITRGEFERSVSFGWSRVDVYM